MTNIAICGSMKFAAKMEEWRKKLIAEGFNVFVPGEIPDLTNYSEADSQSEATRIKIENDYIRAHFNLINKSEGILVLNYDKAQIKNYIGGNSLMEIGFAFFKNRDIFLINEPPEISYKPEIDAMQPIIINGELDVIKKYYQNLPAVFLSSENVLKVSATSLALREYNLRFNVIGTKTNSGITEQPGTIEETYRGAENRLADLKKITNGRKYKMLISIESGNSTLHNKHNIWGLNVCIIENEAGKRAITINSDLEIPKEMTDLVPSKYSDLGILAQEKYGIKNKDPYLYFTNGKLSREKLLYNSVVNTLACL